MINWIRASEEKRAEIFGERLEADDRPETHGKTEALLVEGGGKRKKK